MCEATDLCKRKARFYVQIRTVPQPLGSNGKYGKESAHSGRSQCVCTVHLASTIRELSVLDIRAYNAAVTVRPI